MARRERVALIVGGESVAHGAINVGYPGGEVISRWIEFLLIEAHRVVITNRIFNVARPTWIGLRFEIGEIIRLDLRKFFVVSETQPGVEHGAFISCLLKRAKQSHEFFPAVSVDQIFDEARALQITELVLGRIKIIGELR